MAKRKYNYHELAKMLGKAHKPGNWDLNTPKGFKIIGQGAHRTVVVHVSAPEVVFKVRTSSHDSNKREWEFWDRFRKKPEIASLLVPCVKYYKRLDIIVQRRAKIPRRYDLRDIKHIAKTIGQEYVTDVKSDNCGVFGGKVRLLDYGISDTKGRGNYW